MDYLKSDYCTVFQEFIILDLICFFPDFLRNISRIAEKIDIKNFSISNDCDSIFTTHVLLKGSILKGCICFIEFNIPLVIQWFLQPFGKYILIFVKSSTYYNILLIVHRKTSKLSFEVGEHNRLSQWADANSLVKGMCFGVLCILKLILLWFTIGSTCWSI